MARGIVKSGSEHPKWKGGMSNGYVRVYTPNNPRGKRRPLHIVIAEKALGHLLPMGAVVHHVDEIKSNNQNNNLVICESRSYHQILHTRQNVINKGGDPRTHKVCSRCDIAKRFSEFHKSVSCQDGFQYYCISCMKMGKLK